MKIYLFFALAILLSTCADDSFEIDLTPDYIDFKGIHGDYNSKKIFRLQQIKLDGSTDSALKNHEELANLKVISENSFKVYMSKFKAGRIHFNERDPEYYFIPLKESTELKYTIGSLEKDSWYLISNLNAPWAYYIYLNKEGQAQVIKVNPHDSK